MKSITACLLALAFGAFACQGNPQARTDQQLSEVPARLPAQSAERELSPAQLGHAPQAEGAPEAFANVYAVNAEDVYAPNAVELVDPKYAGYCQGIIETPTPQVNIACCPATCESCTTTCANQNDGIPGPPNFCCASNVRYKSKRKCGTAPCYYPKLL
jgi:hypothetical protein